MMKRSTMTEGGPRWRIIVEAGLGLLLVGGSAESAHARAEQLPLHMRQAPSSTPDPVDPRGYRGPTSIRDEPGRELEWVEPESSDRVAPSHPPLVPPPSSVRQVPESIGVAIGLGLRSLGTQPERALLAALEESLRASTDPTPVIRHLRPGTDARRACRERRDDLVIAIDYIADRQTPVVLTYDCGLDRALDVRAAQAVHHPELVATLWREHIALLREGVKPRRHFGLRPGTRGGIIAGVAIIVIGGAVAALVANALREELVVITVRP